MSNTAPVDEGSSPPQQGQDPTAPPPTRGDPWGPIGNPNPDVVDPGWLPSTPENPPPTGPQQDAFAELQTLLRAYGLEALEDWAWQQIVENRTETQILQSLREQQVYRDRFSAIFEREAQGLPPISPEEVLAYEKQAVALMRNYGFPETFWDTPQDLARLLVNDISPAELEERLQGYVEAAVQAPPEYRAWAENVYGFGPGDLATIYADPETSLDVLNRRWRQTALGGEAAMQGWGGLTREQAERLDSLGVDQQAAREGFGELSRSRELFTPLDSGEDAITHDQQLAALGGDAQAQDTIEQRRRRRQAAMEGGGGFATSERGIGGLGRS